jgi:hypothetical protein
MVFTEPVYLIPSAIVHAHSRHRSAKESWFVVHANTSAASRDRWAPYQLSIADVGPAVLRVISGLPVGLQRSARVNRLSAMPGLVWVKPLPKRQAA